MKTYLAALLLFVAFFCAAPAMAQDNSHLNSLDKKLTRSERKEARLRKKAGRKEKKLARKEKKLSKQERKTERRERKRNHEKNKVDQQQRDATAPNQVAYQLYRKETRA